MQVVCLLIPCVLLVHYYASAFLFVTLRYELSTCRRNWVMPCHVFFQSKTFADHRVCMGGKPTSMLPSCLLPQPSLILINLWDLQRHPILNKSCIQSHLNFVQAFPLPKLTWKLKRDPTKITPHRNLRRARTSCYVNRGRRCTQT